jgi:hypothetical protein
MESYIMIFRDGVQYGPYTVAQVNQYLASGELVPTDLAWPGHGDQWLPVTQLPGVGHQPVAETVRMPETPAAEAPIDETVEMPQPILETVRIPDSDRPVYKSMIAVEPTQAAPVQSAPQESNIFRRRRRSRSTPLLILLGIGWWISFMIFFFVVIGFGGGLILGVIGSPLLHDHAARVGGGVVLLSFVISLTLAIWLTAIGRLPGTRKWQRDKCTRRGTSSRFRRSMILSPTLLPLCTLRPRLFAFSSASISVARARARGGV